MMVDGGDGNALLGLLCGGCNAPVSLSSSILSEKVDVLRSHVYSYDLEVFGREISMYSATNPNDNRFDVLRVKMDASSSLRLNLSGDYCPDHSWFPPYEWCFANCRRCDAHLGWGFALPKIAKKVSEKVRGEYVCAPGDQGEQEVSLRRKMLNEIEIGAADAAASSSSSSAPSSSEAENEDAHAYDNDDDDSESFVGLICTKLSYETITKEVWEASGVNSSSAQWRPAVEQLALIQTGLRFIPSAPRRVLQSYINMLRRALPRRISSSGDAHDDHVHDEEEEEEDVSDAS